jgi:hypothetical protein
MTERKVSVGVDANVSPFVRGMTTASAAAKGFAHELESADSQLSRMVQASLALAPALVPLGAAGVPAVAGLATQLGFAAGAAGTAVLAFQGIGDALDAVNKAQLEPTEANLEKMRQALDAIGPAGAEFVLFLQGIRPELQELQNLARQGMFPGFEDSITALLTRAPEVESVVSDIAETMGDLARRAGQDLAGPEWDAFFEFLDREARPTLTAMGEAFGNVVKGLADLIVTFEPAARMFTAGMVDMSESFADWADGLAQTDGFRDFLAYVRQSTPQALDALEGIARAVVSLVEATAPVGRVVLPLIEALADAIATVAATPLGGKLVAVAAGINAMALALKVWNAAGGKVIGGTLSKLGTGGTVAAVGVVALYEALDTLSRKLNELRGMDFENTNRAIEALADGRFTNNLEKAGTYLLTMNSGLSEFTHILLGWAPGDDAMSLARRNIGALDQELATMVESGNAQTAAAAMDSLKAKAAEMGVTAKEVASSFPQYALALRNAGLAADGTSTSLESVGVALSETESPIRGHGAAFRDYADDARSAVRANYDFLGSLEDISEKLQDRADLRAYRQALRDFRKAIKDAPDDMRHGSKAWDEVEAKLDGIASSALAVADTMNEVDRIKFLDKARGEFIKAAKQMGLTRKQARDLADELGLLDKNDPRVRIDVNTSEAEAAVHRFKGLLDGLDGDTAETFIRVTTEHVDTRLGGPKVATGGYISGPGGPTDDKIPAWLSNGEFVVRAAAVDHYGLDTLHDINAMRFAEGGYALAAGGTLPNLTRKDA